ncbi:hypothetical protein M8J77_006141 [Diaphorina citri]|nr:hypothetical protein M8J77_006141 [Diaphorina citri]
MIIENILLSRKNVVFIWVPSHAGIHGNEKADQLATHAFDNSLPVDFTVDSNDLKTELKKRIFDGWRSEWLLEADNNLRQIKNNVSPTILPPKLNRREQVAITRLRLGHTHLTHNYLMNRSSPPSCDSCHQNLSVKHILDECTKFSALKMDHHLSPDLTPVLSTDPNKIISFLKESKLLELL